MNRPTVAGPGRLSRRELAILAATWLAAAAYLLAFVPRGWVAGDEGMLGHFAERVLQGELPNVEFRDLYTGGLSCWHALAFRALGVEILSMRWFLYAAALLFVPVVFRLARRVASPTGAAGFTLLAVVWTVPNYFTGMPSWYVLFLATGALLALVKHAETGRRRWLVPAGACLGAAFLVKSTGLLYLAAALLFLVYLEQEVDREPARGDSAGSEPAAGGFGVLAFRLFETLGLSGFVVVLVGFFRQRPGVMEIVHHVVPGVVLSIFLLWRVWRRSSGPAVARFRRLAVTGGLLMLGGLLPVAVFLAPYVRRGVLLQWLDADMLFQSQRLELTVWSLPAPATLICALPLAVLFAWPLARPARSRPGVPMNRLWVGLAALGAAALLTLSINAYVYQTVWLSLRPLVPILVLSGVAWLSTRAESHAAVSSRQRQTTFLILAFTALASISQFPYARALYFCYIAPLVALAWLFVADRLFQDPTIRGIQRVFGVFFGLFALTWLNLGWWETMDYGFRPLDHSAEPALDRARGLRVTPGSARLYEDVVAAIDEHSEHGDFILATPDAAVVYFLANRRNPTATILGYLDDDFGTPARDQRLLRLVESHQIEVVVLRRVSVFTPLSPGLVREIERRFPGHRPVGPFSIHWRDKTSPLGNVTNLE